MKVERFARLEMPMEFLFLATGIMIGAVLTGGLVWSIYRGRVARVMQIERYLQDKATGGVFESVMAQR